jgi:uncharacterized membrane protein YeaQ/YmgE (transglycosylase-associated protein family)
MTIFAWTIVGLIAGWIVDNVAERNHDLLTSLVVGTAGAFSGGFLASSLLGYHYAEGLNVPSLLLAATGAIILLAIFRIFFKRDPQP